MMKLLTIGQKSTKKTIKEQLTFSYAGRMVPSISQRDIITSFTGLRPVLESGDFYDRSLKRRVPGSLPALPGIFGLILANMAYKKLINPYLAS